MKQTLKSFIFSQILIIFSLVGIGCSQKEVSSVAINEPSQERSNYSKYQTEIRDDKYFEGIRSDNNNELIGQIIYNSESKFVGGFIEADNAIQLITGYAQQVPYGDKYITGEIENKVYKNEVVVTYTDIYRKSYRGKLDKEYNENGKGKLLLKNGTSIEIECDNGAIILAQYTTEEGNIYKGKLNDKYLLQGKGTINYKNGSKYKGNIVDGLPEGKGTINYKDNDFYTGEFKSGKKEGVGTYSHNDGTVISGKWKDDIIIWAKEINYTDGSIYTGGMSNGEKVGYGKIVYKNRDIYEGSWYNDTYSGQGKYTFSNGEYYEGTWIKGKLNGTVRYVNKKGDIYTGTWENGVCKKITQLVE